MCMFWKVPRLWHVLIVIAQALLSLLHLVVPLIPTTSLGPFFPLLMVRINACGEIVVCENVRLCVEMLFDKVYLIACVDALCAIAC